MSENQADIFRTRHLLALLEGYEAERFPIDFYVSKYFREHTALGSKDRAYIAEELYRLIRWKGLLDFLIERKKSTPSWKERLNCQQKEDLHLYLQDEEIPPHVRVSMPQWLYEELIASWGEEKARDIALACNEAAPTSVRVNLLKSDRKSLLQHWEKQGYLVSQGLESESAIYFHKKINFFCLPEFREGLFEMQDEGSQLVAQKLPIEPHQQVLDFCAGSGGKSLAFAHRLQGTGQIFLHDVRKSALIEAKKRLKRAGIQNAQVVESHEIARLKKLKRAMCSVIVDAPCSGTGTLRRNPDMKWKFSREALERLVSQQRVIFEQALSFVKPKGYILYVTCSILKQENRGQLEHFLRTYPIEQEGDLFESVPEPGKKDGFFAALFRRKN